MDHETPPETRPDEMDAWTARFAREPVGQVPIDLICLVVDASSPSAETSSAADTMRRKGRLGQILPVELHGPDASRGESITAAFGQVTAPLFVVTDSSVDWNRDILERLIKAIDHCDMAMGARPCESFFRRIVRWISSVCRGIFWGAGVLDPLTPYKLGRSVLFRSFPLQSSSRFAEVEMIAKANFLDALIDELSLPVAPPWTSPRLGAQAFADRRNLFRGPIFRHQASELADSADRDREIIAAEAESPEPIADVRTPGNGD